MDLQGGSCPAQVLAARQAVPYSRADVELMPDREEAAAQTETAMRASDACNAGGEADMAAVMRAVQSASVAAAAAAGVVRSFCSSSDGSLAVLAAYFVLMGHMAVQEGFSWHQRVLV